MERRCPSDLERVLAVVPIPTDAEVSSACDAAQEAFERWRSSPADERRRVLESWATLLEEHSEPLARQIAVEIGKPVADGRREVTLAAGFVRAAATLPREDEDAAGMRRRPHGAVGVITPWNNPLAIPAGKIAPAVALGNAVVWKAAVEAPAVAGLLHELLLRAGAPPGLVQRLVGDASTAEVLIDHPAIRAVSLTGSTATGRAAAMRCARRSIPFQAELGGNNAAIVLADHDFRSVIRDLALSSFSCAGQRCTATRRWIVERSVFEEFQRAFVDAVRALRIGDPLDEGVDLGPMSSSEHRARIMHAVSRAVDEGAHLLCGGDAPRGLEHGCWMNPAVLSHVRRHDWIAQSEVFGPVAILKPARDLDEAIDIANGVEHGLVATLLTNEAAHRARFMERIEAGLLHFAPGPLPIAPGRPFGGWKSSGLGPPEHGEGDPQFYARPQVLYGGR